jgi:hypothetical protein
MVVKLAELPFGKNHTLWMNDFYAFPDLNLLKNKKFWEALTAYFPFPTYWTRTAYKTPHPTVLYCFLCICCHGNAFTEPLPRKQASLLAPLFHPSGVISHCSLLKDCSAI